MLHEKCFQATIMIFNSKSPKEIAIESYIKSQEILKNLKQSPNKEKDLREVLELYLNMFWFFKDKRVEIAKAMHNIGKNLAMEFECKYKWDKIEEFYYTDCPNILLHNDSCSICRKEPLECEHITGEVYDGKECIQIVTDLDLITFDVVKEPEMVYTRVTKIPYDKEFILSKLKDDIEFDKFEYGKSDLYCHHCLSCSGYNPKRSSKLWGKGTK